MASDTQQITVQALYSRALKAASKASKLPTIDDETQELVHAALADLRLLTSNISSLHLFSKNETLEDVPTRDLVYLSVPFIFGQVALHARAKEREERLVRLRQAQGHFQAFVSMLDAYEAIPSLEKKLYMRKASAVSDPSQRREVKIAQFKKEKEIKGKIEAVRRRRGQPYIDLSNSYDLVYSMLVPRLDDDGDDDDDDIVREVSLLLLRLQWAQTAAHLEGMEQELELLRTAPPEKDADSHRERLDDTWKLDRPAQRLTADAQGPLLDSSGRPARPFTILPSAASSERSRLQAEVFRADHRLPTMTVDQYLAEEQRRGNIISGGGAQSAAAPTTSEQLALDSEMEGTLAGDARVEEKRLKDENWARFTDDNPRGAGNTMNRG